jgi:WD40 repeat protein
MKSFQGQGQSKLGLVQSLLFPRGGEEEEFIMREPLVLNGHSGSPITALAFHFEGMNTTLASGSSDGTVILWDIINGELN